MSGSSSPTQEVLVIAILIAGVCFLTLAPSLYIVFHALQWDRALQVLEIAFLPALFIGGIGALYAYQRVKARRQFMAENGLPPENRN
ncbi:MAG: hypothetical protein OXP66_07860 [Candidatus Tectomicrobia bacterium]|nr:hypothetical protein [Candidatus Tectomicrobia bacterium]